VHEEAVPEEGAFEYKVDEGVEDVPDEEYAGFVRLCRGRARKENPYAAARTATVPRREKIVVWSMICVCTSAGVGVGVGALVGILEREHLCILYAGDDGGCVCATTTTTTTRVSVEMVQGRYATELSRP